LKKIIHNLKQEKENLRKDKQEYFKEIMDIYDKMICSCSYDIEKYKI
jgi:hypothetical protein